MLLLAVVGLLAGCGASDGVRLGADDNGGQVELERSQVLVVALDARPARRQGRYSCPSATALYRRGQPSLPVRWR